MFEKYVLCFDRVYTMTADGLAAKIKYSPELGEDVSTNPEEHIEKSVYNPNLRLIPYLDGKIFDVDQEAVVLKYINQNNGFKNIKKKEYIENDWQKKKVTFLPEVETMYSHFMAEK